MNFEADFVKYIILQTVEKKFLHWFNETEFPVSKIPMTRVRKELPVDLNLVGISYIHLLLLSFWITLILLSNLTSGDLNQNNPRKQNSRINSEKHMKINV